MAENLLNPEAQFALLLAGDETFSARDIGAIPVNIAADPRFDGIVACQDPTLPDCRITQ